MGPGTHCIHRGDPQAEPGLCPVGAKKSGLPRQEPALVLQKGLEQAPDG